MCAEVGYRLEPHVASVLIIRVFSDVNETCAVELPVYNPEHVTIKLNDDVGWLFGDGRFSPMLINITITNINNSYNV